MVEQQATHWPDLFGLLWPHGAGRPVDFSPNHWVELGRSAHQHRLAPLLHQRSQHNGWNVPAALTAEWAAAYRRGELRSLRQKAELIRLSRWLGEAGIEHQVLKGGAIAWRGWIQPAIRPMRDLDLYIPAGQAEAAQRLLIARGFSGEATRLVANSKHLPQLRAPRTGTIVELHTRLFDTPTPEWSRRDAAFGGAARSHAQLLSPREGGFPVFADEDTLLHVIAHAVLDNQFNSGPLLLVDVAALLGHGTIDWPRFWQTAGEAGLVRAAQLALALAQAVTPGLVIDWQSHAPQELDPKVLASAAGMMLVPVEQRTELGFAGRLARFRWAERWRILLDSIARNRAIRAAAGPDDGAGSDQGLTRRFANAIGRPGRLHIRQSLAVAQWLRE